MVLLWPSLNATTMNINAFALSIHHARKRTGVLLADEKFSRVVKDLETAGYVVIDMAQMYNGKLFYTDDYLVDRMRLVASTKPVLIINLELFVAPRLGDGNFVEQLARKMVVSEPKQSILMLFYSLNLFRTFSTIYQLNTLTQRHTLDLIDDSFPDEV